MCVVNIVRTPAFAGYEWLRCCENALHMRDDYSTTQMAVIVIKLGLEPGSSCQVGPTNQVSPNCFGTTKWNHFKPIKVLPQISAVS